MSIHRNTIDKQNTKEISNLIFWNAEYDAKIIARDKLETELSQYIVETY